MVAFPREQRLLGEARIIMGDVRRPRHCVPGLGVVWSPLGLDSGELRMEASQCSGGKCCKTHAYRWLVPQGIHLLRRIPRRVYSGWPACVRVGNGRLLLREQRETVFPAASVV